METPSPAYRAALIGMLSAVAFLLMALIQLPLLPSAPYLRYDPSDAVALLGGAALGARDAVLIVALKDVLFLLFRAHGPFGPLADFVAAGTFVGVTSWALRRASGSMTRRLVLAAVAGTAARVAVMAVVNFPILWAQFGLPAPRVVRMLLPAIVPFNALKAVLNALIAIALIEPWSRRVGKV